MSPEGHGLLLQLRWHHDRYASDSQRLNARPKSGGSRHSGHRPIYSTSACSNLAPTAEQVGSIQRPCPQASVDCQYGHHTYMRRFGPSPISAPIRSLSCVYRSVESFHSMCGYCRVSKCKSFIDVFLQAQMIGMLRPIANPASK